MGLRKTERKMCDRVHGFQSVKWTEVTESSVENEQNVARELFRLSQHHIVVETVKAISMYGTAKWKKKNLIPDQEGKHTHTNTHICRDRVK